jgi:hypothetical protein
VQSAPPYRPRPELGVVRLGETGPADDLFQEPEAHPETAAIEAPPKATVRTATRHRETLK